ncbi:MAG: protein translocase subunit SecD, partial [Actinomycetota bacterium]|nr:protein translocase subunit SecD [Actinomycetota bacterium]
DLQGGVSITLLPAPGQGQIDQGVLDQTVAIIRQRVDALGVAEPDIARQGETILVQLPGVADREQAVEVIGRTAQLQFRPVLEALPPGAPGPTEGAPAIPPGSPGATDAGPACEALTEAVPPPDQEVVLCERTRAEPTPGAPPEQTQELPKEQWRKLRLGPVALGGADVTDARAQVDPQSGLNWSVALELSDEGAAKFAEITGQLACIPQGAPQRQLAIVLDGVVESAPQMSPEVVCNQGIVGGQAVITTGGSEAEAKQLALVLRTGALPIQLEFAEAKSVSPTLGRSSLQAGLLAGAIGLVLVAVYLILLYRGLGVAALLELAMFGATVYGIIILLGEVAGFALTLAGIAGVIVSIGIAADSSIIYRERYRDELRAGRTVRTAGDHAYRRAFRTNLTGNTVSFMAAAILYFLAVGPVRGFAFTLGLSTLIDTLLFMTFTRSLFGLITRSPKLGRSRVMGLRAGVAAEAASR